MVILIIILYTWNIITQNINNSSVRTDNNEVTDVYVHSYTKSGYTVIKISKDGLTQRSDMVVNASLPMAIFILGSIILAVFIIRNVIHNKGLISLKVRVKTRLIDYQDIQPNNKTNNTLYKQGNRELYILAKSLSRYPNDILLQLFRVLCRTSIGITVLLEKYPGENADRIIDIIKYNGLSECVQLKYVGDRKYLEEINTIELDEIIRMIEHSSLNNRKLMVNETSHNYEMRKQKLSHTDNYIIVFGRKGRYFVQKELYNTLKQGISLKELRAKYDDRIYNIIMDMYNDGIIIISNGKIRLIAE